MSEVVSLDQQPEEQAIFPKGPISRRNFIKTLSATGAAAVAGGAILAACGGGSTTTTTSAPVTLTLGTWPFTYLPSNFDAKKGSALDNGVVSALKDWVKANPNVTLKQTQIDVSSSDKLIAAISAKTAPCFYFGLNTTQERLASTLGYGADTTQLVNTYKVNTLLADYAKPFWDLRGNANGTYCYLPLDAVGAGAGVYFRLDQIKAKGLQEPTINWNWNDFYTLAKGLQTPGKYVMGAPSWMLGWAFNSNMLDINALTAGGGGGLLGSIPAPNQSWHWRVKWDPWLNEWKDIVSRYRKARFDEKLILQDSQAYPWEGPAMAQFAGGSFPMSPGYGFQMSLGLDNTGVSIRGMAKTFGKPLEELVGFLPYPYGTNGGINNGNSPHFDVLLLNPHLNSTGLDKATSLWLYMYYGDGYIDARAHAWEATKDITNVYDFIAPGNRFQKNPKVPDNVTVQALYGNRLVSDYMNAIQQAPFPDSGLYYPIDTTQPPVSAPHDDMLSKLSSNGPDIVSTLMAYQNVANQEMAKLTSDLDTQTFTNSSKQYFKAIDSWFQKNAPTFYSSDWHTYYNNEVLSALG